MMPDFFLLAGFTGINSMQRNGCQ